MNKPSTGGLKAGAPPAPIPTTDEQVNKCIELTVDLWNAFVDIPASAKHDMDNSETCRDIYNIQNRLMSIAYHNQLKLKSKFI